MEAALDAWNRDEVTRRVEHLLGSRRGLMPFGQAGPICTSAQGIYTVSWPVDPAPKAPKLGVLMDFDYLSTERRTGETHAELTITLYGDAAANLPEFRTRLNLLSLSTRGTLAKQLTERYPNRNNWLAMLDQAVQWVLSAHRVGEPAVVLTEAPDPPHVGSVLPPLIAEDGPTIFFGDGGASKSYLALAVAASLHGAGDVIPGMSPTRTLKVAYLDWEWSAHVHKRRLLRLLPDAPPPILYVPMRLSLKEERDRLRRVLREHGSEFLVIDSAGLAAGGAPEEAEVAIAFFATLRELGLPNLIIAHVNRGDSNKGSADRPFGSAYWHNSARSTWYIKAQENPLPGQLHVALFHRKDNEEGRHSPIGLRWRWEDDHTWIESAPIEADPSLEEELPIGRRITLLLREVSGPLTQHEMVDKLGKSHEASIRMALRRGAGKYFVRVPGGGGEPDRWALAAREDSR